MAANHALKSKNPFLTSTSAYKKISKYTDLSFHLSSVENDNLDDFEKFFCGPAPYTFTGLL